MDASQGRLESRIYVHSNDKSNPITALTIRAKQRPAGFSTLAFLPAVVRIVAMPGENVSGRILLRLTTFGGTNKDDGHLAPALDGSTSGVKFNVAPMNESKAGAVAQFGQDAPVRSGTGIAVTQLGRRTLLWAVNYQLNVGDELGVFQKLGVARVPKAGPDAAALVGFFVEVLDP